MEDHPPEALIITVTITIMIIITLRSHLAHHHTPVPGTARANETGVRKTCSQTFVLLPDRSEPPTLGAFCLSSIQDSLYLPRAGGPLRARDNPAVSGCSNGASDAGKSL